jgi:ribosomal protein L16 Arg81 hydroxylase
MWQQDGANVVEAREAPVIQSSFEPLRIKVDRYPKAAPKASPVRALRPTSSVSGQSSQEVVAGARKLAALGPGPATLRWLLDPVAPEEFRAKYYGQLPLYISGAADKFRSLFTWQSLNQLLNSCPDPHPKLRLFRGGVALHSADAADVLANVQSGATLVLDGVDRYDMKVGAMARRLSAEIGEEIQVNLYVSQPGMPGFVKHYDTTDVFLLQTAGRKIWRIHHPTIRKPVKLMRNHLRQADEPEALRCRLTAGDVLYIPRGFWHEGLAEGETSAHLTVGIHARTGIDFLNWLADELASNEEWRQEMPMVFPGEEEAPEVKRAAENHLVKLRGLLRATAGDPDLAHQYQQFSAMSRRPGATFHFPFQFSPRPLASIDGRLFQRAGDQEVYLAAVPGGNEIQLCIWNMMITVDSAAEALITRIFTSDILAGDELLREFSGALGAANVSAVCSCLVAEGLLAVVEN